MVASWYFTRCLTIVRPAGPAVIPRVHASGGARGQYLGHPKFCLMSWRLVDGWIVYFRYWFSVTQTLTWIYVYRSVTYISWSSDFALYLEDYLMGKCHNWNIGFLCYKNLPHKMYVGQWPTFHGSVILSYILKTTWWINVVLEILIQCDKHWTETIYVGQWPIFHGPVILPYILNTIWWTNVIIGILDPCDAKSQWPTFHGPVIWSYILKTIWWINVVLEILIQCATSIELKLYNM